MEASEFSSVLKDALSVQDGLLYIINGNDQLIGASNLEQYRTMSGSEIAKKTVEKQGSGKYTEIKTPSIFATPRRLKTQTGC